MNIKELTKQSGVRLNAVAQAVRLIQPALPRARFFTLLGIPQTRQSRSQYWDGAYQVRAWAKRSNEEQLAAAAVAVRALAGIDDACYEMCWQETQRAHEQTKAAEAETKEALEHLLNAQWEIKRLEAAIDDMRMEQATA